MEKYRGFARWATESELNFIDKLDNKIHSGRRLTRLDRLKSYRASCDKRVEWGKVDKYIVLAHLHDLIKRENSVRAA